jgi:hypothetical protein
VVAGVGVVICLLFSVHGFARAVAVAGANVATAAVCLGAAFPVQTGRVFLRVRVVLC